jgi:hypothetical protein
MSFNSAAISSLCGIQDEQSFTVSLDKLRGFGSRDLLKIRSAAQELEVVLRSDAFRQRVLHFGHDGDTSFSNNNGLSNEQVYDTLMSGREDYSTQYDSTANLDLTLYKPPFYKRWSVVGYGYPGTPEIYLNRNYFQVFTVAEVAGNLAHEWCHKLGFDHDYKSTSVRPYSVPYAVGEIVTEMAARKECVSMRMEVLNGV